MIKKLKQLFTKEKGENFDVFIHKIKAIYEKVPIDDGGGCSLEKASTMALLIKRLNLKYTADIGVYRGRSLFPQAIAHNMFTGGKVFGIDPYSNVAAIQNDKPEIQNILDDFAKNTDFNRIFNDVNEVLHINKLDSNCVMIREYSEKAKSHFLEKNIRLGLVHIDGNHDTSFVVKDVNDYLPLLINGGVIVLDDISWDSVNPALKILNDACHFVGQIVDDQNDFAVFLKSPSESQLEIAKTLLIEITKNNFN